MCVDRMCTAGRRMSLKFPCFCVEVLDGVHGAPGNAEVARDLNAGN